MHIAGNAAEAIGNGRDSIQSVIDWFRANWNVLPIGLSVAAAIVLVMLGLRWLGSRLDAADPDCRHWRGVIGRVLREPPSSS